MRTAWFVMLHDTLSSRQVLVGRKLDGKTTSDPRRAFPFASEAEAREWLAATATIPPGWTPRVVELEIPPRRRREVPRRIPSPFGGRAKIYEDQAVLFPVPSPLPTVALPEPLMPTATLLLGDCLDVLPTLAEGSADSCVTDPPYELGFMGKGWDRSGVANRPETWAAVRRVLKPGAYLLAFGGTRTHHRMMCAIEDAGFAIRDTLMWIYGQGFPKAKSCLKPAWEPIVLAWNPSRNVPPLNIDGCRIGNETILSRKDGGFGEMCRDDNWQPPPLSAYAAHSGRWPANLVLTCCGEEPHAEGCPVAELDRQSGSSVSRKGKPRASAAPGEGWGMTRTGAEYDDSGGASRFFYCAKASKADRGEGNNHPTVKPLALMSWLARLITPEGGTVLDPFMGSGSTGVACLREGFSFIGIEAEAEHYAIAEGRISRELAERNGRLSFA